MPDDKTTHEDQDLGPSDNRPAANDPGPIEVDYVMKNITPPVSDPMADHDLHLGTAGHDDTDSAR